MNDDKFDQLIAALYEAVIDPTKWRETVGLCGYYAGGVDAHMTTIDKHRNIATVVVMAGTMFPLQIPVDYESYYIQIDPHVNILRNSAINQWNCCHHTSTPNFVDRSEFFQDFLIPRGLRYGLFAVVDEDEDSITTFVNLRPLDMKPFEAENQMAARRFGSHLQRALRLQAKMQGLQTKVELGSVAIDTLALSMLIVDAKGKILHLNQAAESMLDNTRSDLSGRSGRLSAIDPADKTKLLSLIAGATTSPASGGAMLMKGDIARQLFVTPLPATSSFVRDWQMPLALVLVTDAGKALSTLELIGKLYHLSPAELRLASALLSGKSPEEYARDANVTMNTIRSQLKSLFSKTGTHRQSELVALLSRVPPLKPPPIG